MYTGFDTGFFARGGKSNCDLIVVFFLSLQSVEYDGTVFTSSPLIN